MEAPTYPPAEAFEQPIAAPYVLSLENVSLRTGGTGARGDVSYVALEIIDAQGRVLPDAMLDVQLSLAGSAELLAFGSANPFAIGSLQAASTQTWNGRALVILRGTGRAGRVKLQASADGLRSASTALALSTAHET